MGNNRTAETKNQGSLLNKITNNLLACFRRKTNPESSTEPGGTAITHKEITTSDLGQLLNDMRIVKWVFHFTRNNPMHTKRFYYALISKVGLDNWKKCDLEIRLAWEEAANCFDLQFGLVKAWKDGNMFGDQNQDDPKVNQSPVNICELTTKIDDIDRKLIRLLETTEVFKNSQKA